MLKPHGIILTKVILISVLFVLIMASKPVFAIYIGDLTFVLDSDNTFVSKRVLNNNKTAKIYRVSVSGIDNPVGDEVGYSLAHGEVLFAPRMLTLQPGSGDYFKFFYRGVQDDKERYYRVSFSEIPTNEYSPTKSSANRVQLEPVVVLDSILVVRPRQKNFSWSFNQSQGMLKNTGNTFFKLIAKPGCDSTEEQGKAWYLRPGDKMTNALLKQTGDKFIVYSNKYIKISHDCE